MSKENDRRPHQTCFRYTEKVKKLIEAAKENIKSLTKKKK